MINNLMLRGQVAFDDTGYASYSPVSFNCYNNLFQGGGFNLTYQPGNSGAASWYVKDNLFDRAPQSLNTDSYAHYSLLLPSNNGFTTGTTNLLSGSNNKTGLTADYQAGVFGNYYYPTNGGNLSQLIDAGSRAADAAGLYNFTTTTNQIEEQCTIVDIGYHYPVISPYDSTGTDFWLTWPNIWEGNDYSPYMYDTNDTAGIRLIITEVLPASGTVSAPGLGLSQSFTVTPGISTTVILEGWNVDEYDLDNDVYLYDSGIIKPKGIHVMTDQPVSVVEDDDCLYRKATWLCYPTPILGTNYYIMSRSSLYGYSGAQSEFTVVATANNTHVTITNSSNANLHIESVDFFGDITDFGPAPLSTNITLQAGDTFQLWSQDNVSDATGTHITSDRPIGVVAGDNDANVPYDTILADNPLMQEMLPVESWGRQVFGFPFATRSNGDTYRVLAAYTNTQVSVNGIVVTNLNQGQFYEFITNGIVEFNGSQPIQVAQFANGIQFDNPNVSAYEYTILGDPTMILLTPAGRFMNACTISIPDDWSVPYGTNVLNLVAEQSALTTTYVNNQAVSGFRPIGGSGFYGYQLPVTITNGGPLIVSSFKPLAVEVYGFTYCNAYGHMGGLNTAPLAAVADGFNTPLSTSTNLNVLANDIYSNLTSVTVSLPANQGPAHGSASVNSDQSIHYTPTSGYSGDDSFVYKITENGNVSSANVIVHINDRNPVAVNDATNTAFATPVIINVLKNDSDPDGDAISLLSVGPSGNGVVWINPSSNTVTYAFVNDVPLDSFIYTITDGRGGTSNATVTVTNNSY
jgi:hypothetical protein